MKKILVATRNPGKLSEISNYLNQINIRCVSLNDLNIQEEIEEDGKDYWENSKKKALFYAKISNLPTIGDDAGLEIDALNGEPGHKARRWPGYEASDEELIAYMEKITLTLPDDNRTARFRAVLTLALPDGKFFQKEGIVEGVISREKAPHFKKGYPYDSFFYLPKIKAYYHTAFSKEYEKQYNHRYKAIKKLIPIIQKYA